MSQKKDCSLIEDLLPLYVEGLVSKESKLEIEKHLQECNSCSKILNSIKQENKLFSNEDNIIREVNSDREKKCIKSIKTKILIKIIIAIVISIILTSFSIYILDTFRIIQDENGKYILYNTKTGNIKKGIYATNMYAMYTLDSNGKEIEHNIIFTFDKNDVCINARTIISGYEENELNNIKRSWENTSVMSNIKIEGQRLYINDNIYIGKKKPNILESLKEYNAKIIEM